MFNNITKKIINFFKSGDFSQKIRDIIQFIIPDNWADNKKAYVLFWTISIFTVSFVIWASFAEINQVVRANGTVIPDSKVHLVQSNVQGPIEEIKVSLGDEVKKGDVLFLIDYKNYKSLYELAKIEVETRKRKVEIIEDLVSKGSDSEFRLLDERLAYIESKKRYDIAKSQYEFASVKSPVTGSISRIDVTNVDQVINAGNLLAEVVPEDDFLKIEALINPKDIAYVKVGQQAMIGFSAYDQAIFGRLEGVVKKVAANTTETEDMVYYPTIIEINQNQVKENSKIILQSGLVSDVSIIGAERTVISFLINPITKLSQTALQE